MSEKQHHDKTPVTILTGFLGSGKTTLLGRILKDENHGLRIAVIENEFATPIGLKNEMKNEDQHEHDHSNPADRAACVAEITETSNGCLCCSGKGDFLKILHSLSNNTHRFDYLIVETTGMADPSFASIFVGDALVKKNFYLDSIITVVDAAHAKTQLDQPQSHADKDGFVILNETVEQIAYGDRILINKIDLVDENQLKDIENRVRAINPSATVHRTQFSDVDIKSILNTKLFNLNQMLDRDEGFLAFRPQRKHDDGVISLSMMAVDAIDPKLVEKWYIQWVKTPTIQLYRSKGIIHSVDSQKYVMQGVADQFEIYCKGHYNEAEPKDSKFVFIGRGLDVEAVAASFYQTVGVEISYMPADGFTEDDGFNSIVRLLGILFLLYSVAFPQKSWQIATSPYFLGMLVILGTARYFLKKDAKDLGKVSALTH